MSSRSVRVVALAAVLLGTVAARAQNTTVDDLPAESAITIEFLVTVGNPLPTGVVQVSNQGSVAATNAPTLATDDPSEPGTTDPTVTPVTAQPDLTLTKGDGGASATPGGTVAYALGYANAGNQAATGIALAETVPDHTTFNASLSTGAWSCADGSPAGTPCTLAVGALAGGGASGSATFAVTVINPVPAGVTEISNSASIADDGANGTDSNPGNNSATDTTPVTAQPDLTLTKSDGGASAIPGGTVAYALGYANAGNQGATGVALAETVPANTTFNGSLSTAGWSCADGSPAGTPCTLAVGALVGGGASGSATFAVTLVTPVPAGLTEISNSASVADDGANGTDPNPGDNSASDTTPVTAQPDLTLTKDDGGITVTPGSTIPYTLGYSNAGNQAATGVALAETVPADSTFNGGLSTAGWSCADGSPAGTPCTLAVGALAGGGASGAATFAVTVVNPVPAGVTQVSNSASLADDGANGADPNPGDNSDTDVTPVDAAPDFVLTKSYTGATPFPGDTIAFDLDYSNDGNQNASGVVLTETVPDDSTFDAAASTAGWSCADGAPPATVCTLAVGLLSGGGATGAAVFAVELDDPLPGGTFEIENCASIADDGLNGPDPNPADNSDCETVDLDQIAPTVAVVGSVPDDGVLDSCSTVRVTIDALTVEYSEAMADPAGDSDPEDVTNPANYRLFAPGPDRAFSTALCGPPAGDDVAIPVLGVTWAAGTFTATADVDPLADGQYRLLLCPTLEDAAGNPLDGNSTPSGGDEHEIDFRVDSRNRFKNGHFDCDLTIWQVSPDGTGDLEHDPAVDLDNAPASGSARIDPLLPPPEGPSSFALAQCTDLSAGDYELVTRARVQAGAGVPVTFRRRCEYFSQPACATSLGAFEVAQNRFDSGGAWLSLVDPVRPPATAVSALCTVKVETPTGALFVTHLDQLTLRPSPLLFRDSFETGDTTRWSSTVP